MATEPKNPQPKEMMTTSSRKKLVKAICQEYSKKFDPKAPKVKKDLNYTQIKDVMFLRDETKIKFKQLAFDEKIDPRDSLDKWRVDVILEFKDLFKFDSSEEDTEDVQIELASGYEKFFHKNFPESKKKISPANIKISDFLTYMGTVNRDSPLPNLVKYGVLDFGSWRLKDLKMDALNSCREFFGDKKRA